MTNKRLVLKISDNVRLNKSKFLVLANQLWNLEGFRKFTGDLNLLDYTRIASMIDNYLCNCYEIYNVISFETYDDSYQLKIKCEMPYKDKDICEDSAKESYKELIEIFNEYGIYFSLDDKDYNKDYSEILIFAVWIK